jgi:hypothetical protein
MGIAAEAVRISVLYFVVQPETTVQTVADAAANGNCAYVVDVSGAISDC